MNYIILRSMLTARFEYKGNEHEGVVAENALVTDGLEVAVDDAKLLPPVTPTKIIGCAANYRPIIEENDNIDYPDFPILFYKPLSSLIGHDDEIIIPTDSRILYEGELAVVINEQCRDVPANNAMSYIRGFTCVNDITALDYDEIDSNRVRNKSGDTFTPIGPYLQTEIRDSDPELDFETRVNGDVVTSSNTAEMIFSVSKLIEEISSFMTLGADDIILTGAAGNGVLNPADVVEVEIEKIGILQNIVI